ncbi:MAG TPA: hypothetical protein VFM38_05420, partial [Candidatus Limnocylindrales bacterium]|nr:hypothetical protein [Candidatus Limnocylindrales bacterium]
MTAQNHSRRSAGLAGLLGILLAAGLVPSTLAADPAPPMSRLESPMADVAVLDPHAAPTAAGTTLSLLVLDADAIEPTVARLSILRRGTSWDRAVVHDVELGGDDLTARWLVGLGEGRYALIATTAEAPATASDAGHAVVVGIEVRDQGGAPAIFETGRSAIDRAIEDSGAADVDGLGTAELVLGLQPKYDSSGSCVTSSLDILDSANVALRRSIEYRGRLGYGVIGRFDAVPGEDLLVHAGLDCALGNPTGSA